MRQAREEFRPEQVGVGNSAEIETVLWSCGIDPGAQSAMVFSIPTTEVSRFFSCLCSDHCLFSGPQQWKLMSWFDDIGIAVDKNQFGVAFLWPTSESDARSVRGSRSQAP